MTSQQIYISGAGNSLRITGYFRYFIKIAIVSVNGTNYIIHFFDMNKDEAVSWKNLILLKNVDQYRVKI